jgi:hypothetical protein
LRKFLHPEQTGLARRLNRFALRPGRAWTFVRYSRPQKRTTQIPPVKSTGENKMLINVGLIVKGEKRKENGKNKTPKPRGSFRKPQ